MKRDICWYLAWGTMVASIAMLLLVLTAGPAFAWTQDKNTYNCDGNNNCTGTPYCGQSSDLPCVYWKESLDSSIQLYFTLDSSLYNTNGFSFVGAVQQAFSQYNSISAWNPYMNQWQSGNPSPVGTYQMGSLTCGKLGNTSYDYSAGPFSSSTYGYNAYWGDYEWFSFFTDTTTTFNNSATLHWNINLDWTFDSCTSYWAADAYEVATHESGHVQGLGHTGDSHPAIMQTNGGQNYYQLQSDDIQGIQGIYPGNQPGTT